MYKILKYFVKGQVIACYKLLEKALEPEPSYILVELFHMCLKEYYFPDCWKVSPMVSVFKNLRERSTAKNYYLVSLLSVVSKIFEKLANNKLADNLNKYGLFIFFSAFQVFLIKCRFSDSLYLLIGVGLGISHSGLNFTISSLMGFCVSVIQFIFPFPQL